MAADLSPALLAQCLLLNYLRCVRLLGSREQEAALYTNRLVEEQGVNNG